MEKRLKQLRKALGLSQANFAQKIEKSPGYIARAEIGKGHLSEYSINIICDKFSVNKEWLLTGKGEMFNSDIFNNTDRGNIGERIKLIRKEHKLRQKDFAQRIGYSAIQIHAVESGKVTPSNEFIHKVTNAFNISEQWLSRGIGSMNDLVLDERLIQCLKDNPDVVKELMERFNLK